MNKKKIIAPSIVLSVSVVLLVLTLLFTTNFVFCTGLNTFNFERIEKCIGITEFAYKINPNYSNLQALYDSYHCFNYYSPYEDEVTLDIDSMPEDYYKKCAKYAKEMYEYHSANPEAYKGNQNSHASFEIAYMSQEHAVTSALSSYIISLYLDGQKEESQKVLNEYLEEVSDCEMNDYGAFMAYVVTVHDLEDDVDFQKWMVEVEEKITMAHREEFPKDEIENVFTRGGNYKPFDWQE